MRKRRPGYFVTIVPVKNGVFGVGIKNINGLAKLLTSQ